MQVFVKETLEFNYKIAGKLTIKENTAKNTSATKLSKKGKQLHLSYRIIWISVSALNQSVLKKVAFELIETSRQLTAPRVGFPEDFFFTLNIHLSLLLSLFLTWNWTTAFVFVMHSVLFTVFHIITLDSRLSSGAVTFYILGQNALSACWLLCLTHRLRTPGEEIAFTAWLKINSHSQMFT